MIKNDKIIKTAISTLATGASLDQQCSYDLFQAIMAGSADNAQIAAILMAMRLRGEAVSEIVGAVKAMRQHMVTVKAPPNAIDIVGTGGDAINSYNISTGAAIVAAASGLVVAKHGSRAVSSRSGASDVLKALGVNIELTPDQISACFDNAGLGFMFAPLHHGALKHVAPVRASLATRTIFNIIGPLVNPARVKYMLLGLFRQNLLEPITMVLRETGIKRAWVVYGADGFDEISTTGTNEIMTLVDDKIKKINLDPQEFGIKRAQVSDLTGGDATHNAAAITAVLASNKGAFRDIIVVNAAAAIVIAGKVQSFAEAVALADKAISSGAAKRCLDDLKATSNQIDDNKL